ncbi:hypothetical protein FHS82_001032 [Pseudochelatococcus lubricantis]|uniref:Uncharacterized protein n=1 Tax=Pseudochelatococcus lubricantis TaxID=1538102 RepID=A0ABX0UW71_9HYPH|nr:hypothetical protein [Pseudochelatococcus lubricantis]NIJ57206.1 hypothetical protein [Pseudochelatococcus lubricantis]
MGRKTRRRQAKRTPSGAISRAGINQDQRATVLAQPHRRWLPETARKDQRAESALGRLYLAGYLTEGQVVAGERWRRLMADYARVIDAPRPTSGVLARMIEEAAGPDTEPPPDDEAGQGGAVSDEEFRDFVLEAFRSARNEIAARDASGAVAMSITQVVIDDMDVRDITHLIVGLHSLATFWRTFDDGYRPIRAIRAAKDENPQIHDAAP